MLRDFDAIIKNGAERIICMAEAEQQHRHAMERTELDADCKAIQRGQWTGFAVTALSIVGAIGTAVAGLHWSIPVALVGVPVASTVRALINGRGS